MNDSNKELDLLDLIKIFKKNIIFLILFPLILILSTYFYFYHINKSYNIEIKLFSIEQEQLNQLNDINLNFNSLDPSFKKQYQFSDWTYEKYHRYYFALFNNGSIFEKSLSELESEGLNINNKTIKRFKIINNNNHIIVKTVSDNPDNVFALVSRMNDLVNREFKKLTNLNNKHLYLLRDEFIEGMQFKINRVEDNLKKNIQDSVKTKLMLLKKQLELGLVRENSSKQDKYLNINPLDIFFPSYLVDNLSIYEVKEQIKFYEKILSNNLFFALDYSILNQDECRECIINTHKIFFENYPEVVGKPLSAIKIGDIDSDYMEVKFLNPWNISTFAKYILVPFAFAYFLLLLRYIFILKPE